MLTESVRIDLRQHALNKAVDAVPAGKLPIQDHADLVVEAAEKFYAFLTQDAK